MSNDKPKITVDVDLTNPGQFFACCGLLELANRLWPGTEGWFEDNRFVIGSPSEMTTLLDAIENADLEQLDLESDTSSPMRLGGKFDIALDWWLDELAGGKALKVWAGSMRSVRIARAMRSAISSMSAPSAMLNYGTVVHDPDNPAKKVEPYYFDCRRGWNAKALDIGFAPDSLSMTTVAFPAVEFLCLVGLQRFRPTPLEQRRVFTYYAWPEPLPSSIASVAACGAIGFSGSRGYRFENAFRTDQKKHKSFLPATPMGDTR